MLVRKILYHKGVPVLYGTLISPPPGALILQKMPINGLRSIFAVIDSYVNESYGV